MFSRNPDLALRLFEQLRTQLPETPRPTWLAEGALDASLPIADILSNSCFYPASGLDSDPIRHLGEYFWSFVFADYGYKPEQIREALGGERLGGYRVLARRSVTEEELPLRRWNSEYRFSRDTIHEAVRHTFGFVHLDRHSWHVWESGDHFAFGLPWGNNTPPFGYRHGDCPFAEWALLERNYGAERPRQLMSLLFVGADGVALLDKLYIEHGAAPACICVIKAPPAMGGFNWTDFTDEDQALARALHRNPAGVPRFLLYGGSGSAEHYKKSCWPSYHKCLAWPLERINGEGKGTLSLWERE